MIKYNIYPCFDHWSRGGQIYIFSDPHFSDPDAEFFRKNSPSDEELVKMINRGIGKDDTLICLGDVGNVDFVRQLRGYKVLVKGNHDSGDSNYIKKIDFSGLRIENHGGSPKFCGVTDDGLFDEVYRGPVFINEKIVLSHEPIPNINFALNIHGHDHSNTEFKDEYHLNVCIEHTGYHPVCLKHVVTSGALKKIDDLHRITIDRASESSRKFFVN